LPEGCDAREAPHKYGIDISGGELFWSADDGANNFESRMDKFEYFCAFAKKLGYKNIFGVTKNINKNEMLGRYWRFKGDLGKAIEYLNKSFDNEEKTTELAREISELMEIAGKNNGNYARIKNYLNQTRDQEGAVWQTVKNRDDLNRFITGFQTSELEARLKECISGSFPTVSLTMSGLKSWVKYILEKLLQRKNRRQYAALLEMAVFTENKAAALKEIKENLS